MWFGWISVHGASGLISLWGSTIMSPWVCTVTSQYPSWYMMLDAVRMFKIQQATSQAKLGSEKYIYLSHWLSPTRSNPMTCREVDAQLIWRSLLVQFSPSTSTRFLPYIMNRMGHKIVLSVVAQKWNGTKHLPNVTGRGKTFAERQRICRMITI